MDVERDQTDGNHWMHWLASSLLTKENMFDESNQLSLILQGNQMA